MIKNLSKAAPLFPWKSLKFSKKFLYCPHIASTFSTYPEKSHLWITSSSFSSGLYYAAQLFMCICLTWREKMLLNWEQNSGLGRRGAFSIVGTGRFCWLQGLTQQEKTQMPSLLLLLAAVLLSPKRIYRTTDRCWDSEAGEESQRDWIKKQKCPPLKKKNGEGRVLPNQVTSVHTSHGISPWGEEREPSPHADVSRSVWGTPGSCSVLNQGAAGNHGELGHKIPSGDSGRREDIQGRGPWNQAFLVLKSLSNTRYLHS